MPRIHDFKNPRFPDSKIPTFQEVKNPRSQDSKVSRRQGVRIPRVQDFKNASSSRIQTFTTGFLEFKNSSYPEFKIPSSPDSNLEIVEWEARILGVQEYWWFSVA